MSKIDIDKFVEHLIKLGVLDYNAVQSALFAQGLILSNYKIEKIGENSTDPQFGKSIEQNPAEWSEEDEKMFDYALDMIEWYSGKNEDKSRLVSDWLKSLKDRYTWKPSEEQMHVLHDLNLTGNISYAGQGQTLIELYNDLKKLKGE